MARRSHENDNEDVEDEAKEVVRKVIRPSGESYKK